MLKIFLKNNTLNSIFLLLLFNPPIGKTLNNLLIYSILDLQLSYFLNRFPSRRPVKRIIGQPKKG